MHLVRSGSSAADIAAIDPEHIGYAQLNDTTLQPRIDNYMEEAMFERMVPGEGELPLRDILSALPADIVIELEVPQTIVGAGRRQPYRSAPPVRRCRAPVAEVRMTFSLARAAAGRQHGRSHR